METFENHRCWFRRELIEAQKKIKKLEGLLAGEIEEVAKLLKENTRLEKELETTQAQLNACNKCYKKLKDETKIRRDLSKAMVVYGDVDISEVFHREEGE